MYSRYSDWSSTSRVSPFGYLRFNGYVHLHVAFRSLSRPSSALIAKAFTLCSFLLDPDVFTQIFRFGKSLSVSV
jgi:hypothetical protein